MSHDRTRWKWPAFCVGVLAGAIGSQLFLSKPAGAGPTPPGTPFTQLQQQVDGLAATIAAQRDTISALQERMVFDNDQWLGWREMKFFGMTEFTDVDGETQFAICPATGPIVQISNTIDGPSRTALLAQGAVDLVAESDQHTALRVDGGVDVQGSETGNALRVNGRTWLSSLQPDSAYHPALEVVGPAWYRPGPTQNPTVTFNPQTDPAYSANFQGPVSIYDPDEPRGISFFLGSRFPISFYTILDGTQVHYPFQLEVVPGTATTRLHATEFIENTPR